MKNNLNYGCIFFLLARGTVGVLIFDLLEKHILFSDGRYWFQMLGRHREWVHKKSEASDAFFFLLLFWPE